MSKETVSWDREHIFAMLQERDIPSGLLDPCVSVAVKGAIMIERPEMDAPDILDKFETRAIMDEITWWDKADLFDKLALPWSKRFSSLYGHGVVKPKTAIAFPVMEVIQAESLSGEVPDSGPIHPAVSPKLSMDEIEACFLLLASGAAHPNNIRHVLSVAEISRALGRSVITSDLGNVLQLEILKTPSDR